MKNEKNRPRLNNAERRAVILALANSVIARDRKLGDRIMVAHARHRVVRKAPGPVLVNPVFAPKVRKLVALIMADRVLHKAGPVSVNSATVPRDHNRVANISTANRDTAPRALKPGDRAHHMEVTKAGRNHSAAIGAAQARAAHVVNPTLIRMMG